MTCIAGIAQDGKVWIGGDSAGVNAREELQLRKDSKVFQNGEYLIGVSGSWRVGQLLRVANLKPVFSKGWGQDVFEHMVVGFLPWLRAYMPAGADFELLVGLQAHLYHIYGTEQVSEEIADYEACGSGAQVARGSLYSTDHEPHVSPEVRIKLALQASERFCSGVRSPFTILPI